MTNLSTGQVKILSCFNSTYQKIFKNPYSLHKELRKHLSGHRYSGKIILTLKHQVRNINSPQSSPQEHLAISPGDPCT